MKLLSVALFFISLAGSIKADTTTDHEIFKAMQDEINRSLDKLKIDGLEELYYIEYTITKKHYYQCKATLGTLLETSENTNTLLTVGVRVGDYQFDQTNFFDINLSFFGSSDDEERYKNRRIPNELDYLSLRRELWLATDVAYKHAAELYSKKRSAFTNRAKKDTIRDFLESVDQQKIESNNTYPDFNTSLYNQTVKTVSSVFIDYPEVNNSSVGIEYIPTERYYMNSEGTSYKTIDYYTGMEIVGFAKDSLGMPISNFETVYSNKPGDLPSNDSLKAIATKVASQIKQLIIASEINEPYSGPVLFVNGAASEIIAQGLGYNFVAQRKNMTEGGYQNDMSYSFLQNKIGARVLPEYISIYNATNIYDTLNSQVVGNYDIDDYGEIPAPVDTIVERGYLNMLLSSRVPNRRVKESSASKRQGGSMYSTLVVSNLENVRRLSYSSLKDSLLRLVKRRNLEYGIIIKKVLNQNLQYTSLFSLAGGDMTFLRGEGNYANTLTYKVYPDGSEELIKPTKTINFGIKSFKEIVYTGDKPYVYNFLASAVESPYVTGGSQYVEATIISPSLLFEDCEVDILNTDYKKPPIVGSPMSVK